MEGIRPQVSGHREGDQSEALLADQVGRDGARRDHGKQDRGVARRGRHDRDHDVVQQADPPLEGAAVDDSPNCGGREWPGGVAKTREQVQPHDADAWAPDHVEGHDAAEDRETAGCPRDGEQMGGLGARVGAGLQGEHLRHDEDRHFDSHDARGAPGQHPPARRQDQKVQACQREGGESC